MSKKTEKVPRSVAALRIDVLQSVLWLRVGAVLRELDRRLDDLPHFAVDLLDLLVGDIELRAQMIERILRLARLLELLLRAVHLRVADVVTDEAIGVHGEEDRALAASRMLERSARRLVHRLDVLAVHL